MGGFDLPYTPTEASPLDLVCSWIEDPSRSRLALNGFPAINSTRFFEKMSNIFFNFLFLYIFFFVLKSSDWFAKKNLTNGSFW